MNQVQINSVRCTLPGSWNELTRKQLLFVCGLFNTEIRTIPFKLKVLKRFLGISKKLFRTISPEDVIFLSTTFDFLQSDVTLTRALIKTIRVKGFPWTRYHGPMDSMSESTFGEFAKAQMRFDLYSKTKDPMALNEMVAILFRPKKTFWFIRKHFGQATDPRQMFYDRTLRRRAKRFEKVPIEIKYAVLLFFSGIQSSLTIRYPNVYKPTAKKESTQLDGWVSLIISLADGKTDDKSLESVMNSNVYNVFFGLEKQSIDYLEFMRKYPTNE